MFGKSSKSADALSGLLILLTSREAKTTDALSVLNNLTVDGNSKSMDALSGLLIFASEPEAKTTNALNKIIKMLMAFALFASGW